MEIERFVKEEEEFLDEWAKELPGFIKDGVVNPQEYFSAKYKILFLLKEVNGGKDWDLRDYLMEGGRKQTWNNGSRWVEGILNLDKEIPWQDINEVDEEYRRKWLNKIAAVNVKKVSGGHTSDMKEIYRFARENAERLCRQINMYEPDIVICGGTEGCYFDEITEYDDPKWEMTSKGIWYVVEPSKRIVISYSHPEARVKDCLLYYGLIDAVREIVAKENMKY